MYQESADSFIFLPATAQIFARDTTPDWAKVYTYLKVVYIQVKVSANSTATRQLLKLCQTKLSRERPKLAEQIELRAVVPLQKICR